MSSNIIHQEKNLAPGKERSLIHGRTRVSDIEGFIDCQERDFEGAENNFTAICQKINSMLLHPADINFERQKGNHLQRVKIKIKYYLAPK